MERRQRIFSPRVKSWPGTCWAVAISPASAWRSEPRSVALRAKRRRAMFAGDRDLRDETTVPLEDVIAEAQRALSICNACRYCEGYCAVFPALERRLSFDHDDVHYLANLCHNCGACLYACQYAPPHAFQLDLPRVLAEVRKETYRRYAWPGLLGLAFARNGAVVSTVAALSLAFFLVLTAWLAKPSRFFEAVPDSQGSFYAIVPHAVMVALFGTAFMLAMLALIAAWTRFRTGGTTSRTASGNALASAARSAATLEYLEGGGDGCTYPREKPSFARRRFHHLTFYGFLLCFAATVVATFDHYVLGRPAPYPFFSAPVLLGTIGGLGLLIGPAGLLSLLLCRDCDLADRTQRS